MRDELPFNIEDISRITTEYPTPVYVYDEARIVELARNLNDTMKRAGIPGYKNFFAVKATPNPAIMKLLVAEGMGLDCSSMAELELAGMTGVTGEQIMYSSNNTPSDEFSVTHKIGAIINFDDISMIEPFIEKYGAPAVGCCRSNPGDLEFGGGINELIIGSPLEAKYGMTRAQLIDAYRKLKAAGTKRFGLHTMQLSNELDWRKFQMISEEIFKQAYEIAKELDIEFEFINLGGGFGVAYHPDEKPLDIDSLARSLKESYDNCRLDEIGSPKIYTEHGRYPTADAGFLVTKVTTIKRTHKTYIGVDASMHNFMRPAMYGAYHHITVLGKDEAEEETVDVVGSLCENNDKFAVDRVLPKVEIGDYVVIHGTGAHGHAMGFQYNGKLRSAELLMHPDKSVSLIRRAETLDDYFSTLTTKGEYHVPAN